MTVLSWLAWHLGLDQPEVDMIEYFKVGTLSKIESKGESCP